MFFVILASDKPDAEQKRLQLRQRHLDYWNYQPSAVKLGGAMLAEGTGEATVKGSAFILEAESLTAAKSLLAADPFTVEGVFGDNIRIEILRPAIGEWKP